MSKGSKTGKGRSHRKNNKPSITYGPVEQPWSQGRIDAFNAVQDAAWNSNEAAFEQSQRAAWQENEAAFINSQEAAWTENEAAFEQSQKTAWQENEAAFNRSQEKAWKENETIAFNLEQERAWEENARLADGGVELQITGAQAVDSVGSRKAAFDQYVNSIRERFDKLSSPDAFREIVDNNLKIDTSRFKAGSRRLERAEARNARLDAAEGYGDLGFVDRIRYRHALNKEMRGLNKQYKKAEIIANSIDSGASKIDLVDRLADGAGGIDPSKVKPVARTAKLNDKIMAKAGEISQTKALDHSGIGKWAAAHPLGTAMMVVAGVSLFKRLTDDDD